MSDIRPPLPSAPGMPAPVAAHAQPATSGCVPAKGLTRVKFGIQTVDHNDTKLSTKFETPAHMGMVATNYELTGGLKGQAMGAYVRLVLESGAVMDGQLVFSGTIDGRTGSVVFRVSGDCLSSISMSLKIIPESATGDLRGIHGEGWYSSDNPSNGRAEGELEIEYF
ncbi:hypothetical protein CspeluHIS016_0901260 [Cutaneotrichosporon spelunceum]|uniref:DUF3224 domain-containing protein n=1 Tax=Cutaneotrichosporon spelunceum TaxID=1672016 RepID=A0AAD3TZU1_9TREE|nr:hypothetical protein CspeluHIS016_0901260 [Cutaneotrichosporon spelunceum]